MLEERYSPLPMITALLRSESSPRAQTALTKYSRLSQRRLTLAHASARISALSGMSSAARLRWRSLSCLRRSAAPSLSFSLALSEILYRRSVTFDNADTTTIGLCWSLLSTMPMVRVMAAQSATDVPPNFITIIVRVYIFASKPQIYGKNTERPSGRADYISDFQYKKRG